MGESQHYEILSIEELEQMKRELALLSSRIDATKRKLVLENKIHDAAQSFSRLDTPGNRDSLREGFGRSPKGHRRSILGSRGSISDLLNKGDDELTSSTKKCEELAQELWNLEKRMQELQRRLLEHTAGVLQVTHTGFLKNDTPPHSPDGFSHYGYGAGRGSVGDESMLYDFDDRSFYRTLDSLLDGGDGSDGARTSSIPTMAAQNRAIVATERRLESLTNRLRESIFPMKSKEGSGLEDTYVGQDDPQMTIETHLNRLEKDLEILQEDRNTANNGARQSSFAIEKRLADLNARIHKTADETSSTNQKGQLSPPQVAGQGLDQQLVFAEQSLDRLQRNAEQLLEKCQQLHSKSVYHQESAGNYEATVVALWDSLASDHDRDLREDSQRDSSGSENSRLSSKSSEPFTLEGFSGKVHALRRKAVHLREQKDILTRQIQQQRELNGKSDEEKDAQISYLTEELERVQSELDVKQRETKEHRDELVLVTQHLDTVRQEATLQERQRDTAARNALEGERQARREAEEQLLADLSAKQRDVHRLEGELADSREDHGIAKAAMRAELEESEKRVQQSVTQVEAARQEKARYDALELQLQQQMEEKRREAEKAHDEVTSLEGEMVHLHTELTVAKAELDAAYGTRAQRAAEMASNPAIHKELEEANERNAGLLEELASLKSRHDRLQIEGHDSAQRVQTLQRELSETIGEYETMTQASIEFEKDREALEAILDALRDRYEELENQLGEEKLKWIGIKGRDSSVPGSTSATVLKNEFKKMMREMRAENTKALRVSVVDSGIGLLADLIAVRTRGEAKARSCHPIFEKGSNPLQIVSQPKHHSSVSLVRIVTILGDYSGFFARSTFLKLLGIA